MKRQFIILAVLASSIACRPSNSIPKSLTGVKEVIAQLDSAVTSMYGWEPRDSTYNLAVDTLVADIMSRYYPDGEEPGEPDYSVPAIQQKGYDDARVTWATFKKLCDEDKYAEALDFYLGDKPNDEGKNAGDFLVFFKHSTQRYTFLSQILLPLMREYRGDEFALKHYIDDLKFEKVMEDFTIAMREGKFGYVPEVYPAMVMDLGYALLANGEMDEAQELFGDIANALYLQSGDALYANFIATKYSAHLYMKDGQNGLVYAAWQDFKDYLEENRSEYDEEELEVCFKHIKEELDKLQ